MVTSPDWRHEPVSIVWRRDLWLSPKPIGGVPVKSDNSFHVGCGDRVTYSLVSPFVLFLLAIALLAIMTAVVAYRRCRAARVELGKSTMRHGFEGKRGTSQTALTGEETICFDGEG